MWPIPAWAGWGRCRHSWKHSRSLQDYKEAAMRKSVSLIIVVLIAALSVPAWAQTHSEAYKDNIYSTGELKPVDSVLKVKVGDTAPDFLLTTIAGHKVTLSQNQSKKKAVH